MTAYFLFLFSNNESFEYKARVAHMSGKDVEPFDAERSSIVMLKIITFTMSPKTENTFFQAILPSSTDIKQQIIDLDQRRNALRLQLNPANAGRSEPRVHA